jgi:oligopeptidase A
MKDIVANPLFDIGFEVPFHEIRAEHVVPAIEALLAEAKRRIDEIAAPLPARTYENTLAALEDATERLELAVTIVDHLESVCSEPALREAHNKVQPEVGAFFASIPLHEKLWTALKELAATGAARGLTGVRRRFLDKTIDDFKRHGADLPSAGKQRLEAISRELTELTNKFSQNLLDSTADWELILDDEAQLAGLPDSAREQARASAEKKGKGGYRFTLQAPSVIAVMTYLDDASIREQVYRAYNSRAVDAARDNRPLINRILELRREKAVLLGYRDFADLTLHDRMAKTGDAAARFVADLETKTRPAFEREKRQLVEFRRQLEGSDAPDLAAWDVGYYSEKQRRALFDFDEEELRPYFPADRVLRGLFETTERLYGIRVEEDAKMPRWHDDVRCYRITENGTLLGAFYADLYPRDEKRGGAWMNGLVTGGPASGSSARADSDHFKPHLGLICSNITPPVGEKPALLTHDEVSTLFHEFGHLLHHMLSRVEVRSLGGTHVAWDFVELPSQIMENWCWERDALDLFARHYETGETIPAVLFEKLRRARTYREGSAMMRQLSFAALDLALHREYEAARDGDVIAYSNALLARYATTPLPSGYAFLTSFGHLFASPTGYAAGYYSYKWAEVLDADAFTRFQRDGVFNTETGRAFRDAILARGDSEEPMDLYKRFMGREPSVDPLLARAGLLTVGAR